MSRSRAGGKKGKEVATFKWGAEQMLKAQRWEAQGLNWVGHGSCAPRDSFEGL